MSEISMRAVSKEALRDTKGNFVKARAHHRLRMFFITLFSDLVALGCSITITTFLINNWSHETIFPIHEIDLVLFVLICLSLYMATKLYPGIGLNPALEIKYTVKLTAISFLIVFSLMMFQMPQWNLEKLALVGITFLSVVSILGFRWMIRILAVQGGVWGEPVVIVAGKEKIENVIDYFAGRKRFGLIPVLGVSETTRSLPSQQLNVLNLEAFLSLSDGYFKQKDIHTVIISTQLMAELADKRLHQNFLRKFKRLIFISDMDWLEGASISYHDFEGVLGMEAQQNFLTPFSGFLKRAMDIFFSIFLGLLSLPFLIIISIMISLDSKGPIFYPQERIGRGGRRITIYKFRSMKVDADEEFSQYLKQNKNAFEEWQKKQKLTLDPRITRVGAWIRKLSIDEMPQLFNIFIGDMSFVGPRPILPEQEELYGDDLDVYHSVRPGLTGFWQVSGRNKTSFQQRAVYDVYYVRNWSIWLDIYILLRTVWVVLSRDGAY